DGLAGGLAADVPERDVDAAHAFDASAAAAHVGEAAEGLVPEPLDVGRVLALEYVADLAQHGAQGAIGEFRRRRDLAPPGDALVGRDLEEQELPPVRCAGPDQPRFDAGDFHFASPSPSRTQCSGRDRRPATTPAGARGANAAPRLAKWSSWRWQCPAPASV